MAITLEIDNSGKLLIFNVIIGIDRGILLLEDWSNIKYNNIE